MELTIDTSTRYAAVGLSAGGETLRELTWRSERNHSVELAPAIREVMSQAGVSMADLEAVFVARGPGAFSALRVGMSLAKAIASARRLPLVAVGTLEVEAQPYAGLGYPVLAVVEAGRRALYVANLHEASSEADGAEVWVSTRDEVLQSIGSPTLVCGEGAQSLKETAEEHPGSPAMIVDAPRPTRRPASLAALAYERLRRGETDSPENLQPFYIRGAEFERVPRRQFTG